MNLETERLILRPWTQEDAPELYKYACDPLVGPAAGWAVHTSVEYSRQAIRDVLGAGGIFAVVPKDLGLPVGCAGLFKNDFCAEDELELGYWVGVPFWGRGYAPEASLCLLEHAFSGSCRRIWCLHYEGNSKSRSVAGKCGFRFEFKKQTDVPAFNERRMTLFYSLTRGDWAARGLAAKEA